jgi:acyl-coenzyme A synthetase/AMP-(fatty) acid ligase
MSLWGGMAAHGALPSGQLHGRATTIALTDLAERSFLGGRLEALRDRVVLIRTYDQLAAALALIEVDGVAQRVVLCPPDLAPEHLPAVIRDAGVNACVYDAAMPATDSPGVEISVEAQPTVPVPGVVRSASCETEWVLLTSGTTGAPKLVVHTLATLSSPFAGQQRPAPDSVIWSTFYDIRRFGGLQIFLRALHAGSLVLSSAGEPVSEFLSRLAAAGITHLSGTPSHWRRALMSGAASRITPRYVRMSGEIADQGILDSLKATYPDAGIAHAFASTEAGVAFEVGDGLAGFPASLVGAPGARAEIRVLSGTLEIRSPGNALRYLGREVPEIKSADGFVDTGDRLELRAGRYHFMGRSGGVINVGGLKVHPEEIEAVINSHPWVQMSLVRARRNPITGAVVAAEVVLVESPVAGSERPAAQVLRDEIMEQCRRALAPHKVPATLTIVPALEVTAAGKLKRPNA